MKLKTTSNVGRGHTVKSFGYVPFYENYLGVYILRVGANNAYASVMYQGYIANKRVPNFSPQDSLYQESLKDESKQLKNVYHDFSEFNPMNFLGGDEYNKQITDMI